MPSTIALSVSAASRAMKGSDYEAFGCAPEGIQDDAAVALCQGVFPVATTVGFDLLSVIVHFHFTSLRAA